MPARSCLNVTPSNSHGNTKTCRLQFLMRRQTQVSSNLPGAGPQRGLQTLQCTGAPSQASWVSPCTAPCDRLLPHTALHLPHCAVQPRASVLRVGSLQSSGTAVPGEAVPCQQRPPTGTCVGHRVGHSCPDNHQGNDFSSGLTEDRAEGAYGDPAISSKAVTREHGL